MLRLFYSALFLFLSFHAISQIQISDAEIILQSRHIWRGEKLGTTPALEPSATLSAGRFSFNIWASLTTNNSYSEIDLIPAYQFDDFQLSLLDYYNPVSGENNQYLNFEKGRTRHSMELTIDNYAVEKRRFKWLIGTFLLGDKNDETGNPYFSTYLEFKYPFTVLGIDAEPFAGITPFHGLYAEKFAIINSGISFSKAFELSTRLSVPITVAYTYNPYQDKQLVTLATGLIFSSGD
jgi:hypothetical protein